MYKYRYRHCTPEVIDGHVDLNGHPFGELSRDPYPPDIETLHDTIIEPCHDHFLSRTKVWSDKFWEDYDPDDGYDSEPESVRTSYRQQNYTAFTDSCAYNELIFPLFMTVRNLDRYLDHFKSQQVIDVMNIVTARLFSHLHPGSDDIIIIILSYTNTYRECTICLAPVIGVEEPESAICSDNCRILQARYGDHPYNSKNCCIC